MQPGLVWTVTDSFEKERVTALARDLGLEELVAELILKRGFTEPDAIARYLHPKFQDLTDPFLIPGMRDAVPRLLRAIDEQEEVLLYGDYDVDGVTSLTLFHHVLTAYGLRPMTFLPHRMDEGYGLSHDGIEKCLEMPRRPSLIVAMDCGTNSVTEAVRLREEGIGLVIIDHHEPSPSGVAECAAVVNPKLGTEGHYFCTAGVAFKVAHGLLKERPLPDLDLRLLTDLVALGTVADIVPLVEENRILVKKGLQQLDRTHNPGIVALKAAAGVGTPVRAMDIGFKLGPRLNAAGRVDSARESLDLLLCEDHLQARRLAEKLDRRNRERQDLEKRIRDEAEALITGLPQAGKEEVLVVESRQWHQGVVGIVASRLMRKYHRPTFVIAVDESGFGKGSGRGIPGLSLVRAIDHCRELLENGGGHDMAAGITIQESRIPEFRARFRDYVIACMDGQTLKPRLEIDAVAELKDLTLNLLDSYELLRPFGVCNSQPVFMSHAVQVLEAPKVIKQRHLKFRLQQNGAVREAMFFGGAEVDLPRPPWDIAYTIDRNDFRGQTRLSMFIQAVRKAG